jgi:NAD-dependent SIR2 family protein deacetylase
MSTFSTPKGLYDRAKKRLKMPASGDGSRLFHARCFEQREGDVHAFLAELAQEALAARPSAGHAALAQLASGGKLVRHYTLNVDGLAEAAGMELWRATDGGGDDQDEQQQQDGTTVELHGSARRVVCRACGARADLTPPLLRDMRAGRPLPCPSTTSSSCPQGSGRTGILLYDDPAAALITPAAPTWRLLERDLEVAAAVVWAGISFEQSASVGYFTRVVAGLRAARDRKEEGVSVEAAPAAPPNKKPPPPPRPLPPQVLINPSEDAMFNLLSGARAGDLGEDVRLVELRMDTDAALPALAARLLREGGGGAGGGSDDDKDEG